MKDTKKEKKSQESFSSSLLSDLKKSGKQRPWRKNKMRSLAISAAYSSVTDLQGCGEAIASCGHSLKFGACSDKKHGKKLIEARFCKARLCVMCQWRKSLVMREQVLDVIRWHREEHSTDVPLLLTLTVVNVSGHELNKAIDRMNDAWQRLIKLKVMKRCVRSWFRSLEVTYNSEREDFHPHFHVLLMVPSHYFDKRQDLYISHEKWLELWKKSMRDDRITQVDIRTVKARKEGTLESLAAEVAKYATKPSSYVSENEKGELEASPKVIKELHYALKGRRLIGFGGFFKKIREEKKVVDVEEVDLVNVEGGDDLKVCSCKICGSPLLEEVYQWDFGVRQYRRVYLKRVDDG